MENLGILVHNRSGVKKNQRDQRQSSLQYRCVSELKMDDADYKVLFFFFIQPSVSILREALALSYLN